MRYTNLEVINKCLYGINHDPIQSAEFSDELPVKILSTMEDVYYDIVVPKDRKFYCQPENLEPRTSYGGSVVGLTAPTRFKLDIIDSDDVSIQPVRNISRIDYNSALTANLVSAPVFQEVEYLTPEEFLKRTDRYTSNYITSDISINSASAYTKIRTDKIPEWYTSFDDEFIFFDSYESGKDTSGSMNSNRIRALVSIIVPFKNGVTDVQDIDDRTWPEYVRACQSMVHGLYKDGINVGLEAEKRRNRVLTQNPNSKTGKKLDRVYYGRS